MNELQIHRYVTYGYLALGVATFVALSFITAPYGRHARKGFGRFVPQRLAWFLMEAPAVFLWGAIYFAGAHALEAAPLAFLFVWQTHYLQRTIVFPFRIRPNAKGTPITIIVSAVVFNMLNAYVNARWVSELGAYPSSTLMAPHFAIGVVVFALGLLMNVRADGVLARLRAPGESGYKIPRGGAFELVSCPNYAGEILEWVGWAIATWSLAGLAFALYTAANLVPRALSHHAWYRATFDDYPTERRALVPYVL